MRIIEALTNPGAVLADNRHASDKARNDPAAAPAPVYWKRRAATPNTPTRRRVTLGQLPALYGAGDYQANNLPPAFDLTFICQGRTFKALQRGRNAQAAAAEAVIELASQCPDFEPGEARLTRAIQVL